MSQLIKGAYDLHVHSGPDILERKIDDLELSQRFIERRLKGYVIKSHYFVTAERAKIANKIYPECRAIGAITLNNAVGGINPMAVEMAARSGAKMVWFPTVDSENEQKFSKAHTYKKTLYWAIVQQQMRDDGIKSRPINIIKNGKLLNEVYEVLDVIAKHDMILSTSHISKEETFELVKAAHQRGIRKIIITHASFPSTFLTVEEQMELLKNVNYEAFVEHCYTTLYTNKIERSIMMDQIRRIGRENVIITTDLGQKVNPYPDEGLSEFADIMLEDGFSELDVTTMIVKNSNLLVE